MRDLHSVEPLAHSPDAAAKRLGVSLRTIYLMLAEGKLRSAKIGKRRLISDDELKAYLQRELREQASA